MNIAIGISEREVIRMRTVVFISIRASKAIRISTLIVGVRDIIKNKS